MESGQNSVTTYPENPGHQHSDTSLKAAEAVSGKAAVLRDHCLSYLREFGPRTADEVAAMMGESLLTIRPRITELRRMGKVRDTGVRRPSSTGHASAVVEAHEVPGGVPSTRSSLRERVSALEMENSSLKAALSLRRTPERAAETQQELFFQ